jgi:dTMP kinase
MKGVFITMEGVEGAGKTTQLQKLRQRLDAEGLSVVVTREPGGTPIAEAIRDVLLNPAHTAMDPMAELLLYEAARAQHVAERIQPALSEGRVVLCDRFADSTTAYQGAGRRLLDGAALHKLHVLATDGVWPDLTLVLDLPVEQGLERAEADHQKDRIELESRAFHEAVRQGFQQLAEQEPRRVRIIDAQPAVEEVGESVWHFVEPLLRDRGLLA